MIPGVIRPGFVADKPKNDSAFQKQEIRRKTFLNVSFKSLYIKFQAGEGNFQQRHISSQKKSVTRWMTDQSKSGQCG